MSKSDGIKYMDHMAEKAKKGECMNCNGKTEPHNTICEKCKDIIEDHSQNLFFKMLSGG